MMTDKEFEKEQIRREAEYDSISGYMDKTKRINKELRRLKKLFTEIDENKKKLVQATMEDVAFLTVTIPNDYKWYYDWFGEDSTCPADLKKILDTFQPGDELEVYINSPGGVIDVGSEIYTMLRSHAEETKIYITGEACSAASIVAMAAYCEMSPTALLMVHCVSSGASGNHNAMQCIPPALCAAVYQGR